MKLLELFSGGFGLGLEIGVVGDELEMDFVIFWVWMIWEMLDYALVLVGFQKVELKGREGRNLENWVWGQTLKQKIGDSFPFQLNNKFKERTLPPCPPIPSTLHP